MRKLVLFFYLTQLYGVELFIDWRSEAKGQEIFTEGSLEGLFRSALLEKGCEIRSWDGSKVGEGPWVFWGLGPKLKGFDFSKMPKEKLILVMWEPPTVQPELYDPKIQAQFGKIFTWDDDLVDGKKFFKFHYPVLRKRVADVPPFEKKKFCVMIARRLASKHPKELYSAREKTIRFFEDKEFDLFGSYWEKRRYKNWRGVLEGDKLEKLKEYKFAVCYENTRDVKGYVTEKIFDCLAGGVVPVYWGASNIGEYVPEDCFVDRRKFGDEAALYQFLRGISKEEYGGYLERAEVFLRSEKARMFTEEAFVENLVSQMALLHK